MQQELAALGRILESQERPLGAILGGAKVSDKLTLVEHLLARVDALLVGGGMAFTFLTALGHTVGRSLVEPGRVDTARRALGAARRQGVALVLPIDAIVANGLDSGHGRAVGIREIPAGQMGLDIGPRTVERFTGTLKTARTIVWNGPMGVFERPAFAAGTIALARPGADAPGVSVIGRGGTGPPGPRAGGFRGARERSPGGGGRVSVPMLAELTCRWTLVGPSERRKEIGESDEVINLKVRAVLSHGLTPVLCVGETGDERRQGLTFNTVEGQLRAGLAGLAGEQIAKTVLAYEPVWAIGTGANATPAQAAEVQGYLRGLLSELASKEIAQTVRILYGGSVKAENAGALLAEPEVDR